MPVPGVGGLPPASCPTARRPREPSRVAPAPARGGRLKPAGRARGWRGRGSPSAAQRLLTLHVFRHLPLFPMRSSQSQGFRLHFGQHDKAAAGGDRGSVSVRKPSTWTRAAQIQLRRKKRKGDWGAGSPTRSRERASASSRGRGSGPLSPVQSRNSGAAPKPLGGDGGLRDAVKTASRRLGLARRGRRRRRWRGRSCPGRGSECGRAPGGQRRRRRSRWCCRRGGAAAAAPGRLGRLLPLPPPALWLRIARGLSLSLSLSPHFSSPPLPPSLLPSRSLSQV